MTEPRQSDSGAACVAELMSPRGPGGIAIIQLSGATDGALFAATGQRDWRPGTVRLATFFGGVDRGVVAVVSDRVALLMPHGGVEVVRRMMEALEAIAVNRPKADESVAGDLNRFPEASDRWEALMLDAIPRLAGSMGIELLLDQPRRWRAEPSITNEDRARSRRLNRLFISPCVVVAGAPNTGKSTLGNAILGRSMSITADLPGTTRDFLGACVDLGGLVVEWIDTPGIRAPAEAIERTAINRARDVIQSADFLISLASPEQDWIDLPRAPDIRLLNKSDIGSRAGAHAAVSARTGAGLERLIELVRDALVPPSDLSCMGRWLFDPRLESNAAL
jgi:tRNA U34 5-carboxymethylaminomethyl modifying GTPase MnmE/TrmE